MPYSAFRHSFLPIAGEEVTRLHTSHPTYQKPLLPKIVVKSLDKSSTYFSFDPFGAQTGKVIYADVGLSLSTYGTFEFQIDDLDGTLDTSNLDNSKRVIISMGKTNGTMYTHLSGMIRQTGYSRGCENNNLYNISGFGTGIRLNERILDVLMDSPAIASDGVSVDTSDPNFAANKVVDDALDRASYYPKGIYSDEVEGTGGLEYINSSGSVVDSPITDFIPGVLLRYGEISTLYDQLENYTGGRIYVDTNDKIQFQPILVPETANTGFLITTDVLPDSDFADNTLYSMEKYSWWDSIDKNAGYSNSIFGILSATNAPDKDSSSANNYFENKTVEIAQKFRPITNPHWRLYCGVEAVGMDNTAAENSVRTRWRVVRDDNGIPQAVGGVEANKYMYPNEFNSTAESTAPQMIQVMGLGSVDLDENRNYWLILSSVNATPTVYWRWYYDTGTTNIETATAPTGTSTATDGGSGWTLSRDKAMVFKQGRFKAEPHNALDVLGVRKRILIESVIPNFPQQIVTKSGAIKYLLALLEQMARPRRVYDFPSLTVPNKPMFPGDVCCIKDSRFGFSTAGNPIIYGQITDIRYSFGIKDGGTSASSIGDTNMSLSVVQYPQAY